MHLSFRELGFLERNQKTKSQETKVFKKLKSGTENEIQFDITSHTMQPPKQTYRKRVFRHFNKQALPQKESFPQTLQQK